jgi:hypothetical protein
VAAGALAAALLAGGPSSSSMAVDIGSDPAVVGAWAPPFDIGTVAVHAVLLRTGRVLVWYWPEAGIGTSDGTGAVAKLIDPKTQTVRDASIPFAYDAFCGGHTVLADGRVFVAGGTAYAASQLDGTAQTATFEPRDQLWTPGASMAFPRWYPSTTELPNGDVLIMSGREYQDGTTIPEVERFRHRTGAISPLPSSAAAVMGLYPRSFLLPDGSLLQAGPFRLTTRLDTKTWTWSNVATMTYGARFAGVAVLLPGLGRVLAFGGVRPRTDQATDTAEILELDSATPQWRPIAPMHHERLYQNAVLLPDGDVLAVGGGLAKQFVGPVYSAELFDTETETWREMAAQTAPRVYHSTAVLLPDGRVLSAGQNEGDLQTTAEIYSPPYLFRGPRPTISSAPTRARYDAQISIGTPDAADIDRVALIRAGSVTHSVNFDQRYVDLPFRTTPGGLSARVPPTAAEAPPGMYMLFVVDGDGVPSVAKWVKVGFAG